MSDAKKCDLCGGFYMTLDDLDKRPTIDPVYNSRLDAIYLTNCSNDHKKRQDLCPDCANKIYDLFFKKEK